MGSNPINLVLRFVLEMSALIALGVWGWRHGDGTLRYVLAIGIPLVAASLWGTFAVANDPSRSARALVEVPGWLRLVLEFAYFGVAVWALRNIGAATASLTLGILVVVHYALSYDRLRWLVQQ